MSQIFLTPDQLQPSAGQVGPLIDALQAPEAQQKLREFIRSGRVALFAELRCEKAGRESLSRISRLDSSWGLARSRKTPRAIFMAYFNRLFCAQSTVLKVAPGTDHFSDRSRRGYGGPDDLDAAHFVEQFASRIGPKKVEAVGGLFSADSLNGTYFLIGGPASNALTRLVLEYKRSSSEGTLERVSEPIANLRFQFDCKSATENIRITHKSVEPNWPVIDVQTGREFVPQTNDANFLETDYLLITVMPNFMHRDAYKNDEKIVIFSGSHGVGTKAVQLLFQSRALLDQLDAELRGCQAWQAVLSVDKIDRRTNRPSPAHLSRKIICSEFDLDSRRIARFMSESQLPNEKEKENLARSETESPTVKIDQGAKSDTLSTDVPKHTGVDAYSRDPELERLSQLGVREMRQQVPGDESTGPIDAAECIRRIKAYFRETSEEEQYNDLKGWAPKLIEYFDIAAPKNPTKRK